MSRWEKVQEAGAALVLLVIGGLLIAGIWTYHFLPEPPRAYALPREPPPWTYGGPPLEESYTLP